MGILLDLFPMRQRKTRGEYPDVYTYDDLPDELRVQIVHIIKDAFGGDDYLGRTMAEYNKIVSSLCKAYGVLYLAEGLHQRGPTELFHYLLSGSDVERVLGAVEVSFQAISRFRRSDYDSSRLFADEAIADLNACFNEHGVGYQFVSGKILRVDSEFMHAELIKPALAVLQGKRFAAASEEFLDAHKHYRHGRNKECLVSALKAFESTLKIICAAKKWPAEKNDTVSKLINTCVDMGLFPKCQETQLGALRTLLSNGVPPLRNKLAGHGQGTETVTVPAHVARYALNLTASTIVLLCEAASLNAD